MTADRIVVTVTLIIDVDWATVFVKICNKKLITHSKFQYFSPLFDKEQGIDFRFKAL